MSSRSNGKNSNYEQPVSLDLQTQYYLKEAYVLWCFGLHNENEVGHLITFYQQHKCIHSLFNYDIHLDLNAVKD